VSTIKKTAKKVVASPLFFGGLFGDTIPEILETPEIPQPPPEPVMPIPDDEAAKRAKRRSLALQRQRGGRQSTILSDVGSETLG